MVKWELTESSVFWSVEFIHSFLALAWLCWCARRSLAALSLAALVWTESPGGKRGNSTKDCYWYSHVYGEFWEFSVQFQWIVTISCEISLIFLEFSQITAQKLNCCAFSALSSALDSLSFHRVSLTMHFVAHTRVRALSLALVSMRHRLSYTANITWASSVNIYMKWLITDLMRCDCLRRQRQKKDTKEEEKSRNKVKMKKNYVESKFWATSSSSTEEEFVNFM